MPDKKSHISCIKTGENSYSMEGLNFADLELIEEAISRLFNESNRTENREFRTQVLAINRPMDQYISKIKYV